MENTSSSAGSSGAPSSDTQLWIAFATMLVLQIFALVLHISDRITKSLCCECSTGGGSSTTPVTTAPVNSSNSPPHYSTAHSSTASSPTSPSLTSVKVVPPATTKKK